MPGDPFYGSSQWKKLRAQTIARARRFNLPCAYCGKPINYAIKGGATVDHIKGRRRYPHLALEPSNLQVVHGTKSGFHCNTKRHYHVETNDKIEIGSDGFPLNGGWRDEAGGGE